MEMGSSSWPMDGGIKDADRGRSLLKDTAMRFRERIGTQFFGRLAQCSRRRPAKAYGRQRRGTSSGVGSAFSGGPPGGSRLMVCPRSPRPQSSRACRPSFATGNRSAVSASPSFRLGLAEGCSVVSACEGHAHCPHWAPATHGKAFSLVTSGGSGVSPGASHPKC